MVRLVCERQQDMIGEPRYLYSRLEGGGAIRQAHGRPQRSPADSPPLTKRSNHQPLTINHLVVQLRGHHLLCLFGFRGLGYDETFIAGMAAVIRRLRQAETLVEIVAGPDDICAACPRRTVDRCLRTEHPRDLAVLAAAGLDIGHCESATTLFPAVAAAVTTDTLHRLCADCSWYALGVCAAGVSAGRIAAGWEE
ncbi:MAG: DUF1284 domain-containing protein [Armatimonadota bacterium]